ncbi:hypothetical protein AVEN_217886-1, partial [Araneus ventricosus]
MDAEESNSAPERPQSTSPVLWGGTLHFYGLDGMEVTSMT